MHHTLQGAAHRGARGRAFLAISAVAALVTACQRSSAEGHAGDASAPVLTVAPVSPTKPSANAGLAAPAAPAASATALPTSPSLDRVKVPLEAQETCRKICERSKQLKCKHADECLPNCYGMTSLTPCSNEMNALFPCLLREPITHWECGDDGMGAIRAGYCDKEQGAAVACMEKKMTP